MNKESLLQLLDDLDLPAGEYVLMGGACLVIRKLRAASDLDLFITDKLYANLVERGWQETAVGNRRPYLINKVNRIPIQAFAVWEGHGWQPQIKSYLRSPEFIDNVPLMPLTELYKWKKATRREKDLRDLALIEAYLEAA